MKNIITRFSAFLNEAKGPTVPTPPPVVKSVNIDKEIPWDFNFDSGKFKKESIDQAKLDIIEGKFKSDILPTLNNMNFIGQELIIELIATTSKVPVGKAVTSELSNAGYTTNNYGLAKARLDTLEDIVNDLLFKNLGKEGEDLKTFLKESKRKLTIEKKALANQGPDYVQGDDVNDEKFKSNQKLSLVMKVHGQKPRRDQQIICNSEVSGRGNTGTPENLYVGFEKQMFLVAKKGTKMTTVFDPFTVPDCFFYSYGGTMHLSPFAGNFGPKLVEPFNKQKFDTLTASAEKGAFKVTQETISGKNYIVWDYKGTLNEMNKDGALVKGIEAKLKSLGYKKTIKEIQPKFFDADGKIEVYATRDPLLRPITDSNLASQLGTTKEAMKTKIIPVPTIAEPTTFEFTLEKEWSRDAVKLAVFSPLSGTSFALKSKC